jgi:hypothetical protein
MGDSAPDCQYEKIAQGLVKVVGSSKGAILSAIAALAVGETPEQVVRALKYVTKGEL